VEAFSGHPRIVRMLDPKREHSKLGPDWGFIAALPLILFVAVVYAAPIWAFTTLVGDRFGRADPDPGTVVPVAAIICATGLVLLVIRFAVWLRDGRRRSGMDEGQAGIAAVLGTSSALVAASTGSRADVPHWPLWLAPIVLTAVVGTVFWWLLTHARRAAPVPSDGTTEALERLRAVVERLPQESQVAVRQDITAALADLEARSVISPDDAARARGAELGTLALRMSQHRGSRSSGPRGS
jgi:hypothetical protein